MPKPAARKTLTDKGIAALKPMPGKRVHAFDAIVPGLAVRVTENGARSFCLITRFRDKQKWVTLGAVGALNLAAAREAARDALQKAKRGEDPTARPAAPPEPDSLADVAALFIEKHAKQNRSWEESKRILDVYVLPSWGRRDIRTISRRDVIELVERVGEGKIAKLDQDGKPAKREGKAILLGGPIMANRTLAAVRKLFAWAAARDIVTTNPATGVEPPGKETSRDRVLSDAELRAFWQASGALPYPWGPFYRLLALTGQRLTEVAGMRWADVDLDKAMWTLPRELTKSDRAHEIPLSDEATVILKTLPRFSGPYVLTTGDGTKHIAGFDQAKTLLEEATAKAAPSAKIDRWTNHDLRRTFATVAAKLGIAPHVVEKALNHSGGTIRGVAAVYNRHSYGDEKRRALEAWARYIVALVEKPVDNVVAMRAG